MAVNAKPLEKSDSAEIVMKIEKINEQLPGNEELFIRLTFIISFRGPSSSVGVQARQNDSSVDVDDAKPKKSQRNYPVYYVNTKVNGKFGKSMRAFTSEEFMERFGVKILEF